MITPTGKDSAELQRYLRYLENRIAALEPKETKKSYALSGKRETNVDSQKATSGQAFEIDSLAFLRLPTTGTAITANTNYTGLFTSGVLVSAVEETRTASVTGTATDGEVSGTASWTEEGVGTGTVVPGTWKALGSCEATTGYYSATLFIRTG